MGISVNLNLPSGSSVINPVANNLLETMKKGQAPIDAMASAGGQVQSGLNQASSAIEEVATDPVGSLEPNINVNVGAVNGSLATAVTVAPPRALGAVSNVVRGTAQVAQGAVGAYSAAREIVTNSKAATALALGLVCLLVSSLLNALMSKLMGAFLRMQRTVLAMIDKVKKAVIKAIKKAISKAMEALPECPQKLKDIAKELKSLLGKASAIIAAVNKLIRDAMACNMLGGAVGEALSGLAGEIMLATMIANSRFIVNFDFSQFKDELEYGFGQYRDDITGNTEFYHNTSYLPDTVTQPLEDAKQQAEENKEKIEELIEDIDNPENEWEDEEDKEKYKEALEDAAEHTQEIIDILEESAENLAENVLEIIDNIADTATEYMDNIQQDLEDSIDDIKDSVNEIFDTLDKQAQEFDTPEVRNQLATACADTAIRTVLEEQE